MKRTRVFTGSTLHLRPHPMFLLLSHKRLDHRIPTPHIFSKSITQMSGLNVSRITDLSTNHTDDLSHPTAISLTTQQSSKSKRSSTRRKKNKKQKQRSQKPLANLDDAKPKEKEPWLDLSFLGDRHYTEKDFLCNYWRNTVADEQIMRLDYFLNVMDTQERELWQGFSDDYVPSWAKFTEVRQGCEGNDEQKWDSGGRIYVKKEIEWRPGPVMWRVPNMDDFSIEDEV
ncbi:hypothetical protein EDD22DRAFT_1052401 [Suillus occidentalis]|nr:hypothetical protein EDD22DRAFT_1052401 [Suillus occidentalis]